jgi:hypothetical protein
MDTGMKKTDGEKGRQGDREKGRQGDRQLGDTEMGMRWTERREVETRRERDKETWVALSPCLPISLSPCLP